MSASSMFAWWRLGALAVVVALALAAAGTARAASFSLISADVGIDVRGNGSLGISERIEVAFDGAFNYGYRDIPLREGESLENVTVAEGGRAYSRGSRTDLSPGPVGTFGVKKHGDGIRIVWYFGAFGERRAFTISYTLSGVAVAYDDVVDVNLQVWGDQWAEPLSRLVAVERSPGRIERAWGKPVWVRGDVELEGKTATLRAVSVPSRQYVELRTLIPRSAFSSTSGMKVADGRGLDAILDEERADAEGYERDSERIDRLKSHPLLAGLAALGLATIPALLVLLPVFWFLGRERRTGYDREYEQEPPTDTPPALVPTLLRQGGEAGSYEFTATLFDLIRKGAFASKPTTTERSVWGGLREETVSDLEVSRGAEQDLSPWEAQVAEIVDGVLDGGSERLSRFREEIEDERESMYKRFEAFKETVSQEVAGRGWFRTLGALPLALAVAAFALTGGLFIYFAIDGWRPIFPRYSDVLLFGAGACVIGSAVLVLSVLLFGRKLWTRRSRAAQQEAERWDAFRRYLVDFPRLQEAPPATLDLWERYLVYGIAFGIAERVLQGAQLHMPEEIHEASTIFWISPGGDLGSGATSLSIGDLASGFGDALAPPNSGSGGLGGGFSGGGGFGGGGGGGGFG